MRLEGSCHLESKAGWVPVPEGDRERHFRRYPDEALIDWHNRHGLLAD